MWKYFKVKRKQCLWISCESSYLKTTYSERKTRCLFTFELLWVFCVLHFDHHFNPVFYLFSEPSLFPYPANSVSFYFCKRNFHLLSLIFTAHTYLKVWTFISAWTTYQRLHSQKKIDFLFHKSIVTKLVMNKINWNW